MSDAFHTTVQGRWGDLDAQGHVNNSTVVDYLQEARVDFFLATHESSLLDDGVVVVGHQVEYAAPVHERSPVDVEVWLAEVRASRFRVAYRMTQDGVECVRARTVLCPFDFAAQRPARLAEGDRRHLSRYLRSTDALRDVPTARLAGRGHRFDVRVRWSDVDRYDHVNNVRFFDFVQEARIAMTTEADPGMVRGVHRSDVRWLVARQDIEYVAQMGHRLQPYQVLTAPVRLGTSSVTLAAEVADAGAGDEDGPLVFGRARTVLVCADESGRPVRLPDATRAALTPLVVA